MNEPIVQSSPINLETSFVLSLVIYLDLDNIWSAEFTQIKFSLSYLKKFLLQSSQSYFMIIDANLVFKLLNITRP